VTGRQVLLKTMAECGVSAEEAARIERKFSDLGYACIPKRPTEEMISGMWIYGLEDPREVWTTIVERGALE
jgi:hypothetical protein